ncbi:hypothetical protein AgCh_026893 [Apium graveolens]
MDLLPSSPGDPRALPEIFDFIDSDEVEQPTAPEFADELEPLISDEDRARRKREAWEDAHSSGKVHPVLSEDFVWTIVELEWRIERELFRNFTDASILRNYASWQEISIKNASPYSMKGRLFMQKDTYKGQGHQEKPSDTVRCYSLEMYGGESVHELTNLIDGIANVRSGEREVLKAPTILQYFVASERGAPSYAESFEPDARGVGLAAIPNEYE